MNFRARIFLLTLTIIILTTYGVLSLNKKTEYKQGVDSNIDALVGQAQDLYQVKKHNGESFEKGPCLTNDLAPGWVVDIVHVPRQAIDDLPENQCQAYREGRAKHFIELDADGVIVRLQ